MKTPTLKAVVLPSPTNSNSSKHKRKRLPELDEVDLDIEPSSKRSNNSLKSKKESPLSHSTQPDLLKTTIRQGLKDTRVQSDHTPNIKTFQPGEKTALLAAIRKRIGEIEARTVYVRHLPRYTTEAQLKKFCPTSIAIKLSSKKHGGNRRGHAFIEFKSEQAARAAVESTNGKLIADRPINLQLCSERLHDPLKGNWIPADRRQLTEFSLNTLAVSCVPKVTTKEDLQALFPKSQSIEIVRSAKKVPTGLCIIRFTADGDALTAFTTQHGALLHGTPVVVNFAYKKGYSSRRTAIQPSVTSPKAPAEARLPTHHNEPEAPKTNTTQKAFSKKNVAAKKKNTANQPKHSFPPKELSRPLGNVKKVGKHLHSL